MRPRLVACAVVLMLAVSAGALAQGDAAKRGARFGGDDGLAAMKKLGLSQDQTKKITAIVEKYRTDVATVLRSSATREEKRKKIDALKSKAAAGIGAVLTPAQRTMAKEKGLIDRLLGRRAGGHRGMLAALDQVNLSEAQKGKIKAIFEDSRTKAKAIGDNKSLSDEQKRSKHQELRQQTMEKVNAVLTSEQKAKLEKLLKDRNKPGPGPNRPAAKRAAK